MATKEPKHTNDLELGHKGTPSWRTWPEGYKSLRVSHHNAAGWTSLSLEESYETEGGKYVSKQTMTSLSPEENVRLIRAIAPGLLESLTELVASPNAKQNAMWDRARAALVHLAGGG